MSTSTETLPVVTVQEPVEGEEQSYAFPPAVVDPEWDAEVSIEKVKTYTVNFKTVKVGLLSELYKAREELSKQGRPPQTGDGSPLTWDGYCDRVGLKRNTINKWLRDFDPLTNTKFESIDTEMTDELEVTETKKTKVQRTRKASGKKVKREPGIIDTLAQAKKEGQQVPSDFDEKKDALDKLIADAMPSTVVAPPDPVGEYDGDYLDAETEKQVRKLGLDDKTLYLGLGEQESIASTEGADVLLAKTGLYQTKRELRKIDTDYLPLFDRFPREALTEQLPKIPDEFFRDTATVVLEIKRILKDLAEAYAPIFRVVAETMAQDNDSGSAI